MQPVQACEVHPAASSSPKMALQFHRQLTESLGNRKLLFLFDPGPRRENSGSGHGRASGAESNSR